MEIALSIALLIGILLFIVGLLIVVISGFKHHFFTGIITLFPFLNFIILPTVWHRAYIGFYLGIIGILLTLGAWYGGGKQYIIHELQNYGINIATEDQQDVVKSTEIQLLDHSANTQKDTPLTANVEEQASKKEQMLGYIPTGDLLPLPKKPLYLLKFQAYKIENIADLKGTYIRIIQKDGKILEGKVLRATANSLFIEQQEDKGVIAFEIKADSISELKKLTKIEN